MSFLALWGAVLSTVLAIIKIYELWRDRFRIEVSYSFTSDRNRGNKVFIRNLSSKAVILSYWELMDLEKSWPLKQFHSFSSPEDEAQDVRIDPLSSYTLSFTELDNFVWGSYKKIYIRLHIAGRRKPIVKKVYG